MVWTIKSATERVGGLSNPSKMPCFGYSIPAQACPIGSKLVGVEGSVCSGCYALKGFYNFSGPRAALARRLDILREAFADPEARAEWVDAFAYLLNTRRMKWDGRGKNDARYFRWHDSGDLQNLIHLQMIDDVAGRTPGVAHWLPTRELPTVKRYLSDWGSVAFNLRIRISANKIGAPVPATLGLTGSGVHRTKGSPENGAVECGAYLNAGECGKCRACWSDSPAISYLKH